MINVILWGQIKNPNAVKFIITNGPIQLNEDALSYLNLNCVLVRISLLFRM